MKLTAKILSNDGEVAQLLLSNGECLHVSRTDPLIEPVSIAQFLEDFPPGCDLGAEFEIENLRLN